MLLPSPRCGSRSAWSLRRVAVPKCWRCWRFWSGRGNCCGGVRTCGRCANAAQRVGQHAEASLAYRTALDIRPGEPRWMLGAAVSMAALGQLAATADMVDWAR